jgi:hypothetical protein
MDQQRTAQRLAEPLPDGGGPVARVMRRTYLKRANPDTGVQAVLQDYIGELDAIRTTLAMTLEAYADVEADAITTLRTTPARQGEAG